MTSINNDGDSDENNIIIIHNNNRINTFYDKYKYNSEVTGPCTAMAKDIEQNNLLDYSNITYTGIARGG